VSKAVTSLITFALTRIRRDASGQRTGTYHAPVRKAQGHFGEIRAGRSSLQRGRTLRHPAPKRAATFAGRQRSSPYGRVRTACCHIARIRSAWKGPRC